MARRLGMQAEGVLLSSWLFEGRRYGKQTFSALRDEWVSTRQQG